MIPFRQIPIEFSTWISISSILFERVSTFGRLGFCFLFLSHSILYTFGDRRNAKCVVLLVAIALFVYICFLSLAFLFAFFCIIFALYTHSVSLCVRVSFIFFVATFLVFVVFHLGLRIFALFSVFHSVPFRLLRLMRQLFFFFISHKSTHPYHFSIPNFFFSYLLNKCWCQILMLTPNLWT